MASTDAIGDPVWNMPQEAPSTQQGAASLPHTAAGAPMPEAWQAGAWGAAGAAAMRGERMQPPAAPSSSAPQPQTNSDSWPTDCEYRQVFRAHGRNGASDTSKFEIAAGAEYTATFYFKPQWDGAESVQLLKSKELIDNKRVVHHWMLYTWEQTALADGDVRGDPAGQLLVDPSIGGQYLLGGVPGATDLDLPADVGLRLASSANLAFSLVVHYYNVSDEPAADSSGVEVCVTRKKRPIDAAAHWLGTIDFSLPPGQRTDVVSTCHPTMPKGPAHIVAYTPHMHRTGVHSRAVIQRASGESWTLHDAAYQFSEQRLYRKNPDVLLNPGDSIAFTCSFLNQTDRHLAFGESSDDEMCFLTVWAWPAGSISNGSPISALLDIAADQGCL